MKTTANEFEVVMNKEHLGQSVQQYLRAYGYFQAEDDFFKLEYVNVDGDKISLKGVIEND